MTNDQNLWWGYQHTSGSLQVKRYFEPLDIQEAHESPFCARVAGPFPADSRDEALSQLRRKLEC